MARDLLGRRKGAGVRGGCASSAPLLHGGTQPHRQQFHGMRLSRLVNAFSLPRTWAVLFEPAGRNSATRKLKSLEMMGFSPRLVGEIERGRGSVGFDRVVSTQ